MPNFNILKETTPIKTFRTESIKGQFDLNIDKIKENFIGNIEIENIDWNIGLIYGASGTGKSTIAKELFNEYYIREYQYDNNSVIDNMPKDKKTEEITKIFNSVGFATAWSWLKPYNVLSNGEQMRVNLARAILENKDLIVFDEFTSVVNREVAKSGSFAVQKAIRKMNKKFIAVACHNDIIEYLEPDWTFCTDNMQFNITRGLLRRPEIKLSIYKTDKSYWRIFRKYHYLDTNLHNAAQCFVAFIKNEPIAFFAVIHFPHPKSKLFKRGHRLVVLPDYQGLGIGHKLSSFIAQYYHNKGYRFIIQSSTKSLLNQRLKDKCWVVKDFNRKIKESGKIMNRTSSQNKYTYSYEYVGNNNAD